MPARVTEGRTAPSAVVASRTRFGVGALVFGALTLFLCVSLLVFHAGAFTRLVWLLLAALFALCDLVLLACVARPPRLLLDADSLAFVGPLGPARPIAAWDEIKLFRTARHAFLAPEVVLDLLVPSHRPGAFAAADRMVPLGMFYPGGCERLAAVLSKSFHFAIERPLGVCGR